MALQKDLNINGIPVKNAYIKVSSVLTSKKEMIVNVNVYPNKEFSDLNEESLQSLTFNAQHDYSDNSKNIFVQSYEFLKETDIFSGSADI